MAKQLNLSGGLGNLIPTKENKPKKEKATGGSTKISEAVDRLRAEGKIGAVGRPRRTDKDNTTAPSAEKGTRPGEMRKTYLVNIGTADKMDRIAYWDRRTVKDVINEAFAAYVASWEKRNGPVKEIRK